MSDDGLIIVNFAHLLTGVQRAQIQALTGQPVAWVLDVPAQMDVGQEMETQVAALVDRVGLSAEE